MRSSSHKAFQAYKASSLKIQINQNLLCKPEKFPVLSKNELKVVNVPDTKKLSLHAAIEYEC